MKIKKCYKPDLCVSTGHINQHLHNLWLDVENKRLLATDGKRLVVVMVEIEPGDTSGPITAMALKEAREVQENSGDGVNTVLAAETVLEVEGITFKRPAKVGFPLATIETILMGVNKREGAVEIGLNARLLYEAATAIGTEEIVMSFDLKDRNASLKITNFHNRNDNLALLMPVKIK